MSLREIMGVQMALKRCGGFVRYFDTTEPLPKLAVLAAEGRSEDILACCGGGDQALTMLGAASRVRSLCAVDINPAQLFVLAAKAASLKKNNALPSFKRLQQAHPGKIAPVKKDLRRFQQMRLCHMATGKLIVPPSELAEKYALVMDGEMFELPRSGPSWQTDTAFTARVRARLGRLRLARMDIFDSPDHFKAGSLDLIYLSDIFWQEPLAYHKERLAKLAALLRSGGRIISYIDPGENFLGHGVSPGRLLAQQARECALRTVADEDGGYLVLERTGRRR